MDFIEKCFMRYNAELTDKLVDAGFSAAQAKEFLPVTSSSIMHFIKNTDLEITIAIFMSDNPSQILNLINADVVASIMGMNSDQVTSGFEAIAPALSQAFKQQSNEIVAATASLAWSYSDEILESTEKLFS